MMHAAVASTFRNCFDAFGKSAFFQNVYVHGFFINGCLGFIQTIVFLNLECNSQFYLFEMKLKIITYQFFYIVNCFSWYLHGNCQVFSKAFLVVFIFKNCFDALDKKACTFRVCFMWLFQKMKVLGLCKQLCFREQIFISQFYCQFDLFDMK